MRDQVLAVLLVQVDQYLGVAVGGEPVPARDQLLAQLDEVVDLSVEDRRDGAVLVVDGLASAGHVDDGESPHPQRRVGVGVVALSVGPPMSDEAAHRPYLFGIGRAGGHDSSYTAHKGSQCVAPSDDRSADIAGSRLPVHCLAG